jgi:hypothetical protein
MRVLLIGFFAIIALATTMATPAQADDCYYTEDCAHPVVTSDGYSYLYSDGQIHKTKTVSARSSSGRPLEFFWDDVCAGNAPTRAGQGVGCMGATLGCSPGQIRMWLSYREVGTTGTPTRDPRQRCIGPNVSIPVGPLLAGVREELEKRAPQAAFAIQPKDMALVQLPVIVHAISPDGRGLTESIEFDVTQPVPGHLEAHPTYEWDFGEGFSAIGVGIAYDGTSPRERPDYYVSHAYTAPGRATVTLRVLWRATFTVAGIPPLTLEDLPRQTSQSVRVVEARSQLVAG